MYFCNAKRAEVTRAAGEPRGRGRPKGGLGRGMGSISKKLGQMWRELTPSERKPYEDQYTAAKAKYDKKMEEYEAS